MNLPNKLTVVRVLMIPFLYGSCFRPSVERWRQVSGSHLRFSVLQV